MSYLINNFTKKTLTILATVLIIFCAGVGALAYHRIASIDRAIFEAGAESIEETYAEVGQVFREMSYSRWNYLYIIGKTIQERRMSDDELKAFVDAMSDRYTFTDFFFISESGEYITIDGERGYLDFGRHLPELSDEKQDTFIDGSLPGRDNMLFYAVTTEPGTYRGAPYRAVAFGYSKADMTNILSVAAFDGQANTYITYNNGRVVMSMLDNVIPVKNIFATLQEIGYDAKSIKQIEQDFREGVTDTCEVTIDGEEYYLSYQPARFQGTMIVSLVSKNVANLAINDVHSSTMALVAGVLIAAALVVALILFIWVRRLLANKNSQLYERELIFNIMAENADEIYILYIPSTRTIRYVSPNIDRLLGVKPTELYADMHVMLDVCENPADWLKNSDPSVLRPGDARRYDHVLKHRATRAPSQYAIELYRIKDRAGDGIVVTMSNRTRELKIRQEIEEALALAEEANKSKSAFLSNMSHDIRTPMNAIIGFTTLLSKNPDNALKVTEYTAKIAAASKHLLSLINDVLDMSKIEAGKMVLHLETIDVAELVHELQAMIVSQARSKNQEFELAMELADGTAAVAADRLRLSQILLNILSNAIKYTPAGGSVTMRVASELVKDGKIARYKFTVSDTGIGMSPEYLEVIFAPFSREIGSTTNKIEGTGLGMSITHNMVQLMGGTITVESEQGVGSTFEVTVELRLAEQSEVAPIIDHEGTYDITGLHVLAAEDNELNAEILSELLEDEGVTCDIAENGQIAVDKFLAAKPGTYDLILMDVQMPVLNGYDATRKIRAANHPEARTIPIIAMTANAFVEDVQEAIKSGMNEHLAKPIYVNGLKQKLSLVLHE